MIPVHIPVHGHVQYLLGTSSFDMSYVPDICLMEVTGSAVCSLEKKRAEFCREKCMLGLC